MWHRRMVFEVVVSNGKTLLTEDVASKTGLGSTDVEPNVQKDVDTALTNINPLPPYPSSTS